MAVGVVDEDRAPARGLPGGEAPLPAPAVASGGSGVLGSTPASPGCTIGGSATTGVECAGTGDGSTVVVAAATGTGAGTGGGGVPVTPASTSVRSGTDLRRPRPVPLSLHSEREAAEAMEDADPCLLVAAADAGAAAAAEDWAGRLPPSLVVTPAPPLLLTPIAASITAAPLGTHSSRPAPLPPTPAVSATGIETGRGADGGPAASVGPVLAAAVDGAEVGAVRGTGADRWGARAGATSCGGVPGSRVTSMPRLEMKMEALPVASDTASKNCRLEKGEGARAGQWDCGMMVQHFANQANVGWWPEKVGGTHGRMRWDTYIIMQA
jgi:hypothetical protein